MEHQIPKKLNLPKLDQFDGTTDPEDHLAHYQNCMALQNDLSEALLCRAFTTSLKGAALTWFQRLPSRSIHSFPALAERFTTRFITSRRMRRVPGYLLKIYQKPGESLRHYVSRFSTELATIDGCSDDFVVSALAGGLLEGRLADSLHKHPPSSVTKMLEKTQEYIKLEEVNTPCRGDDSRPRRDDAPKRLRPANLRPPAAPNPDPQPVGRPLAPLGLSQPIDKIFRNTHAKVAYRYPPPLRSAPESRIQNRFCDFHNDTGHRTADCRLLAAEIERLSREGLLQDYQATASASDPVARIDERLRRGKDPEDSGRKTIFAIHAGPEFGAESRSARKRHLHHLYTSATHPGSRDHLADRPLLTFTDQDRHGLVYPHQDALLITLSIADYDVHRILIDTGSGGNILYDDTYRRMSLPSDRLLPTSAVLSGFIGEQIVPIGKIDLPVQAGHGRTRREVSATFYVIKSDSPYNAILGRAWLHEMRAVSSSYHQCLKYPVHAEVGVICGDQLAAQRCHTSVFQRLS